MQLEKENTNDNPKLINDFISAKRIEGCSEKTLKYYRKTIETMVDSIEKGIRHIQTEDLRSYLTDYQSKNNSSKVTIDNIRRILSSFFSWLEDEDYILKSPVRRIHKVKTATNIKETYTDEELERMRDSCVELRDLAIIDMLASTGMRIGEMVLLNKADINFNDRECVVLGKGDKERVVYFDARTKIHLQNYIDSRTDENPASGSSSYTSGFPFWKNATQISQYLLLSVCFTDMIYLYIHIFSPPITNLVNNAFKRITINQNLRYLCSII